MTSADWAAVVSNFAIALGYAFVAIVVVPGVTLRLWYTRVGGIVFFATCGLHHLENAFHVLFEGDQTIRHAMHVGHMLAIDIPQAIAVWMFVTGLYLEAVRWGPWRASRAEEDDDYPRRDRFGRHRAPE